MTSTFFGLELSTRALNAQQLALDVSGNNISNASTTGYTREIPDLTTATPYTISVTGKNLSLGSGTDLDTITRARDAFVDRQFRTETSNQQYWGAKQDNLTQVENLLNEPTDNSLSTVMNQFWTAWSSLSTDPTDAGARAVVSETAQELTQSFHSIAQQASDMSGNLNSSVDTQVTQINTYAQQIKDLNDQIKTAQVAGDNPNDLMDQRDNIVDKLSAIVNVKVVETQDPAFTDRTVGNYKVIIGNENSATNNVLVDGDVVNTLQDPPSTNAAGSAVITWSSNGAAVNLGTQQGTLASDIDVRDQDIPHFMTQLNTLAQSIASSVNAVHRTGQGSTSATQTDSLGNTIGIDFFTATDSQVDGTTGLPVVTAATINLNPAIADDPNKIATGAFDPTTVIVGDGSIAQNISSLATGWDALTSTMLTTDFGGKTPVAASSLGDYYAANVAQLGVSVQQATQMKAGEDVLVTNVTNQRESISGVSLDEEMTNLIQYQKSYSAAARMVTMMDSMFDSLLNMGMTK